MTNKNSDDVFCPRCGCPATVTKERYGHERIACKPCNSASWTEPASTLDPIMDRKLFSDKELEDLGIPTERKIKETIEQAQERIKAGKCKHCGADDPIPAIHICKDCLDKIYDAEVTESGDIVPASGHKQDRSLEQAAAGAIAQGADPNEVKGMVDAIRDTFGDTPVVFAPPEEDEDDG